jgi:siroheme synthase-like protein
LCVQRYGSAMPEVFPVALVLEGRRVVVVGSGSGTSERAAALHAAGADVLVVSEAPDAKLRALLGVERLRVECRSFRDADLDGAWLAVLADIDPVVAPRVAAAAEERRVFFCAVDQPPYCSFLHQALVRSGDVVVAISTGGHAPALARRLRQELARVFQAARLDEFVASVRALRERTAAAERPEMMRRLMDGLKLEGELVVPPLPIYSKDGEPGGPGIASGSG